MMDVLKDLAFSGLVLWTWFSAFIAGTVLRELFVDWQPTGVTTFLNLRASDDD